MKNRFRTLLVAISLLFCFSGFSQTEPPLAYLADAIKFRIVSSNAIRDAYAVPTGQRWLIANNETSRLEWWDGDSWEAIGGGASFTTLAELNAILTDATLADESLLLPLDGSRAMAGNLDLDTNSIENVSGIFPAFAFQGGIGSAGLPFQSFNASRFILTDFGDPINHVWQFEYGANDVVQIQNIVDGVGIPATKYTFNPVGPVLGTDLITKDNLDAALPGAGSDNQTASEVPFTPYLTIGSTDTQAAIQELKDEVDAISVGSSTSTLGYIELTADYTLTASDFTSGLRTFYNTSANNYVVTWPTGLSLTNGQKVNFEQLGTGLIQVDTSAESGVSFETVEENNLVAGVQKPNGPGPVGYWNTYTPSPPNILTQNNAATDDTNATTGFSIDDAGMTLNSVASTEGTDNFMIQMVSDGSISYVSITHPANAGEIYDVEIRWMTTATTPTSVRAFSFQNIDNSVSQWPSTTGVWETDNFDYTVTSTGTVEHRYYCGVNTNILNGEQLNIAWINVSLR